MPKFLANCSPEVVETIHDYNCKILCARLEHYLKTQNKEKIHQVAKLLSEEDLRYFEARKDK